MKSLLTFVIALSLLTAGCSNEMATPGNVIRSSLPEKTHTLTDAWPQASSNLLARGRPVQPDTYTSVHDISGSGIMVIDVRSHDFNPVAAVIDGEGNLIAFNDNWKESTSARVVLDGAPSGGKLLIFSPDDTRGLYDVIIEEGTSEDIETFINATDFSGGMVRGWIEEGSYNAYLYNILREALENDVYVNNYSQAELFPFTIDSEELISISLESDDFDPYLILMTVEDGTYAFVEYNDDYSGSYSRIVRELDAGDYIALVMPYSAGSHGRFTLELESIDEEALEKVDIPAQQQDMEYTGEITNDRNYAIAWWPDMVDNWESPGFLTPFTPVAAFTFSVDNTSVYEINASGEMDVCLTVVSIDGDSIRYVTSNDDYGDLGSNSRVVEPLMPGDYIVFISPYSGTSEGEVTFSWSEHDEGISTLRAGRSTEIYAPYETESIIYQLNLQAGTSYSVSVESDEMDPVITLVLPDGESLYDDDGGDGNNSLLYFTVTEDQAGESFLIVEKYSSGEGTFTILFEAAGRSN
ncbi:MAG: hypothetical protein K8S15_00540 [Candidatus Aegiribacteria sp.]|nr:hypothetical protein [Candidatus Aegiribacteria sp.]